MPIVYADIPILSVILLICLGGLLLILATPAAQSDRIRKIGAVSSGLTLLAAIYLFVAYDRAVGGFQFAEKISWIPSFGISYFNAVDGFSLPMLLLTGIVFFTGVLTMWELEHRVKEFFALIFLLVLGVLIFSSFSSGTTFPCFRCIFSSQCGVPRGKNTGP